MLILLRTKLKHGFTLIELMVVISIISFMSTIVLASLNEVKDKAIDTVTVSNLQQIDMAIFQYKMDNGNYPPQTNLRSYDCKCNPNFIPFLVEKGYMSKFSNSDCRGSPNGYNPNDICYLNNEGNIGGAAVNRVEKNNIMGLLCNDKIDSANPQYYAYKAAMVFYLKSGPSDKYRKASFSRLVNVICYE